MTMTWVSRYSWVLDDNDLGTYMIFIYTVTMFMFFCKLVLGLTKLFVVHRISDFCSFNLFLDKLWIMK